MVKKLITFCMSTLLIFLLVACGNTEKGEESISTTSKKTVEGTDPAENAKSETTETEGKPLVVYFSWSTSGNTEKMATYIQEQTGGDILELIPANQKDFDRLSNMVAHSSDDHWYIFGTL